MQLFSSQSFSDFQHERIEELKDEINALTRIDSIEMQAKELIEEYQLTPIEVDSNEYTTEIEIENVPTDTNRVEMFRNDRRKIAVVKYDYNLFPRLTADQTKLLELHASIEEKISTPIYFVEPKSIEFSIYTDYANTTLPDRVINEVTNKRDKIMKQIISQIHYLNEDIERFNKGLYQEALEELRSRKSYLEQMERIKSKL